MSYFALLLVNKHQDTIIILNENKFPDTVMIDFPNGGICFSVIGNLAQYNTANEHINNPSIWFRT